MHIFIVLFCLLVSKTQTDNRRSTQPMMREVCLRVELRFVTLDFVEINPRKTTVNSTEDSDDSKKN